MSQTDLSDWLPKQTAADAIGVTTKTIERLAADGKIQQGRWRRDGRGPELAVYHPDDVARLAAERKPAPPGAFLVPSTPANGNGNGHHPGMPTAAPSTALAIAAPPGDDVLRLVFASALRAVSETSQTSTLFVSIDEAAQVSGLSRAYLTRAIADGTIKAVRDRGWRIRRKDLECL